MATALHSQIKTIAKEKPCLVFSNRAIRNLLINNFITTNRNFKDLGISVDGNPDISAKFLGLEVEPFQLEVDLSNKGSDVIADFKIVSSQPPPQPQETKEFTIEIEVFYTKDTNSVFSKIILKVTDLQFKLSVFAPFLKIDLLDFKVSGTIIPDQKRSTALQNPGILETEVIAVEGGIALLLARKVVKSMFATINKINLQEVFRGIDLLGSWNVILDASSTDTPLIIIPSDGITIKKNTNCPKGDVLSGLEVKTIITPGTLSSDTSQHKWPTQVTYKQSKLKNPKTGDNYLPFASLYLTKPVIDVFFNDVIPNITLPLHDDKNMIGFDGSVTISFRHIGVTIDTTNFGLIVGAEFSVFGKVDLNVDVACDRVHLVSIDFGRQASALSVRLSFVTEGSKLVIKPQLENLYVEEFEVTMYNFTKWLWYAGGRAIVIEYILKAILEPLAEDKIEEVFKNALRKNISSNNIDLIDLSSLEGYSLTRSSLGSTILRKFDTATFSSDSDSILVGLLAD